MADQTSSAANYFRRRGITTVFFDIDDTLWWFSENTKVALREAYAALGLERLAPVEDFVGLYEPLNHALWSAYSRGEVERDELIVRRFAEPFAKIGVAADECDALAAEANRLYLDILASQPLVVPGAPQLLKCLKAKGYKLCALSNGFDGIQQRKLAWEGMAGFIDHVVLSDHCGITKPQPGIFAYAQQVAGSAAEHTLLVGDDPATDIDGAHNAGWATIHLCLNGKAPASNADAVVTSLRQIDGLL